MTYFIAVERTNRPQNYHKLPFVMIVIILTTSSLSHSRKIFNWFEFRANFRKICNLRVTPPFLAVLPHKVNIMGDSMIDRDLS